MIVSLPFVIFKCVCTSFCMKRKVLHGTWLSDPSKRQRSLPWQEQSREITNPSVSSREAQCLQDDAPFLFGQLYRQLCWGGGTKPLAILAYLWLLRSSFVKIQQTMKEGELLPIVEVHQMAFNKLSGCFLR